jgi:hypothetical protein
MEWSMRWDGLATCHVLRRFGYSSGSDGAPTLPRVC